MSGYNLSEGNYDDSCSSYDELWSSIACVFSSKSRNSSSYKYGFLKSLIDNLYNVDENLKLSFDQIFSKFGEIYWNLVLKYSLKQKATTLNDYKISYLEQILYGVVEKYNLKSSLPYESLTDEMMTEINYQIKMKCKKYVVGALYEDTNRVFYSFSKKEEWLQFNPIMYEFVCKHKMIIEKLNYYEWAKFLERVNEDKYTVKILEKIDESSKRNNLWHYRELLYNEFGYKNCFYCGKLLKQDKIDVDHFIPWSFMKDDKLWNLVLACSHCNRQKNDGLPNKDFLYKLLERNSRIIIEKQLPEMNNYQDRILIYAYKWAHVNGYNNKVWKPQNFN